MYQFISSGESGTNTTFSNSCDRHTGLNDIATELYLSCQNSGPYWGKLMTVHFITHPVHVPASYSADSPTEHCVQIVHTMGNLPSKMRSILIIAMAERVPYWIWAILVVSNYFKK